MKATRSAAARMHSFRLTLVRRSSSMMPTFRVYRGKRSMCSTRANSSLAKATSSGPCILRIDRGDAVFEIHDGGDRRFQHNVGDARRIIASDQSAAIDLDLQVKTMVAQQHRRWRARLTPITGELGRPRKAGTRAVAQSHQQIGAFY